MTTFPYCGPPPTPEVLLRSWNFDPWLISALIALAASGTVVLACDPERRGKPVCFGLALAALIIAFVSPLCALSSALFSARVAHHLLMISVAAPLLAAAFPAPGPAAGRRLVSLVGLQMVAVGLWHAPTLYAAALGSSLLYWVMETTLLATAVLAWRDLLRRETLPLAAGFAHLAVIALMGLLGALITFAPVPLYAPHALTTGSFGLSAIEDQQLAGLLMWVPAILPNLLAGIASLCGLLEERHLSGRPLRA